MIKRKQQDKNPLNEDSGFTIIESLVAIVVAAALLAGISPVLVLSTATRVQARRVEKASQVARTFIDGVRTSRITVPSKIIPLEAPSTGTPRTLADNLITVAKMPVPGTGNTEGLYCFKKNGTITTATTSDCKEDSFEQFYIQAAQIKVKDSTSNEDGYRLALRVYRSDIDFSKTVTTNTESGTDKKIQKTFTGGLGAKQLPLLEMTTDIANSEKTTFQALCQRLGSAPTKTCS